MLDVYTVTAPGVLENALDYRSADNLRNKLLAEGFPEVTLSHRRVSSAGDSWDQREAAKQDEERRIGTAGVVRDPSGLVALTGSS